MGRGGCRGIHGDGSFSARGGADHLAYFQDDFFYYLQIARNIAEHGRSSFDGNTLTNGYHPLWMLVLVASWELGGENGVFAVVSVGLVVGTIVTYGMTRLLLERSAISSPLIILLSTWIALFYLSIAREGMEIILTIPLGLIFFCYILDGAYVHQPRTLVIAGLLASAVALSRLDTVLMIGIYGCALLLQQFSIARCRQAGWFVLGLGPFIGYLVVNKLIFGGFSPISSQAKHLKADLTWDWTAIHSSFVPFGLVAAFF